MAQGKRVSGFVVGHDTKEKGKVWKVRVKDQTSVHDGKKFEVASTHPGTELSQPSTDVTFRIEPLQVEGEFVLKAVDVADGPLTESSRRPAGDTSEGTYTLNVCASEVVSTGEVSVFTTGLENEEQARSDLDSTIERVVAFKAINLTPPDLPAEVHNGLEIIERLSCIDAPRDGLDYLLSEVFKLGQANPKS